MTEHNLFYYPYASFTNAKLRLLKVAALYFDKLVILDPVGANWATTAAGHTRWAKGAAANGPRVAWRRRGDREHRISDERQLHEL